ncbi:hypothetical protein [Flavobacterium kingsejongi]|nr:hypothetical protein [Flavobacterium kingsejongi]
MATSDKKTSGAGKAVSQKEKEKIADKAVEKNKTTKNSTPVPKKDAKK